MLLSCMFLNDVTTVNNWDISRQLEFVDGNQVDVYIQLTDLSKDKSPGLRGPTDGRRYVPAVGATLSVVIKNIADEKTLTKIATQPFVGDSSIWMFQISATDAVTGTASIQLQLTEGAVVTKGMKQAAIRVYSNSAGDVF